MIVLFAYAVIEPETMMIEFRNTFLAHTAMLGLGSNKRIANVAIIFKHRFFNFELFRYLIKAI